MDGESNAIAELLSCLGRVFGDCSLCTHVQKDYVNVNSSYTIHMQSRLLVCGCGQLSINCVKLCMMREDDQSIKLEHSFHFEIEQKTIITISP